MFSSLSFFSKDKARIERRKHSYLPGKSSIAVHDLFNSFKSPRPRPTFSHSHVELRPEFSSSEDMWYCTDCSFPFDFSDSFFEKYISFNEINDTDLQSSITTDNIINGERNHFPKVLVLNARSMQNKVFDLQPLLLRFI